MDYMKSYNQWLNDVYFDEDTKNELKELAVNEKEIEERFYKSLEFGTGGLRGIIGAGTNRMNIYTVRRATQGLANFILKHGANNGERGVCIAYDSRRFSPEFASQAALVLNGNGIKTYIFEELRPTPELSFAVRHLGCIAGIVVTASHNPAEYNGYKVYWEDGAQIPYPHDEEIIKEVESVLDYSQIKLSDMDEAKKNGLYNIVGQEIDDEYIKNVKTQCLNPEVIAKVADDLTIVYTPLHGAGNKPVRRILSEVGFKNVYVVPEQEHPDPNFSTVAYPNPEDPKAFELAAALAEKVNADVMVATDPDSDRVGVIVKNSSGENVILTGNMTGTLLTEYILSQRQEKGLLDSDCAVISTIVSTKLTEAITKFYSVQYYEVLTGFKYIGERIKQFEREGNTKFVCGFEESYGFLSGTYARDKDAVVSTMLICEMAAYYKEKGMTLYDALIELYKKYGYYKESIESITLKGKEGLENIKKIMNNLRENPPKRVGVLYVSSVSDYKTGVVTNFVSGDQGETGLPKSDVLFYTLEDGSWFCIRPSGTEPKIKIYFAVIGQDFKDAEVRLKELVEAAMATVNEANK